MVWPATVMASRDDKNQPRPDIISSRRHVGVGTFERQKRFHGDRGPRAASISSAGTVRG